ncbi:MAG: translation initiation factor IF-2, partial [Rhodobacteraceae bacterium]|nr:translation initiation factor IF-2 [Paracoccaceae bacterium]
MKMGMMVTQNQSIDADTAELIIEEFGHKIVRVSDADVEDVINEVEDALGDLKPRPPVITIMGHVDHGKTSLLDAIRQANVVSGEAGGITQHIGAYQVTAPDGSLLSFLDTPGHAAFTSMRARGAQVTDIVVLVVAADDSVMPQTIEAINHAKAAKVPMIVAINKCDKPDANPDIVRTELLQHEVIVEAMSGDVQDVEVSALAKTGLDQLLEAISLQSEILELKANPKRAAQGAVIEAQLDVGRGPVATVLVQKGTLKQGDIFVVGEQWGKVRALINDKGERVKEAGPSVPVEVLGLNGAPEAGDVLNVVDTEAQAREIADYRIDLAKEKRAAAGAATTLEQLMARAKENENLTEMPILVKADVQGSAEAIVQAMEKIGNDEVRVRVLHYGVGAITDTDVGLAEASGAPVIGFNVRANASARNSANQKGVEIRYYSIIYDLVDDVRAAASGLLSAEIRENFIGYAQIKEVFKVSGVGKVAGCIVTEGVARRSAGVRLLRDNVVIHEGTLKTLKRFKDEVKDVQSGQECGMAFENYDDIRPNDVIEIFEREEVARTLD